jgi:hypothetical protein
LPGPPTRVGPAKQPGVQDPGDDHEQQHPDDKGHGDLLLLQHPDQDDFGGNYNREDDRHQ